MTPRGAPAVRDGTLRLADDQRYPAEPRALHDGLKRAVADRRGSVAWDADPAG